MITPLHRTRWYDLLQKTFVRIIPGYGFRVTQATMDARCMKACIADGVWSGTLSSGLRKSRKPQYDVRPMNISFLVHLFIRHVHPNAWPHRARL